MPTVINNPRNDGGNDSGVGLIVGILIAIVIVVLFFVYLLPAIRGGQTPQTPNTGGADVNVQLPNPSSNTNGGQNSY